VQSVLLVSKVFAKVFQVSPRKTKHLVNSIVLQHELYHTTEDGLRPVG